MHKEEFWMLTIKCGNNVFVFKLISTFIGQNQKFFYPCVERMDSRSFKSPWKLDELCLNNMYLFSEGETLTYIPIHLNIVSVNKSTIRFP
jgi:hypothetical protein